MKVAGHARHARRGRDRRAVPAPLGRHHALLRRGGAEAAVPRRQDRGEAARDGRGRSEVGVRGRLDVRQLRRRALRPRHRARAALRAAARRRRGGVHLSDRVPRAAAGADVGRGARVAVAQRAIAATCARARRRRRAAAAVAVDDGVRRAGRQDRVGGAGRRCAARRRLRRVPRGQDQAAGGSTIRWARSPRPPSESPSNDARLRAHTTSSSWSATPRATSPTRELAPQAAGARSHRARFPSRSCSALAELGLLGVNVPEALGGAAAGVVAYSLAMTEIARADASVSVAMAVTNMVGEVIVKFGTDEQQRRWVPQLTSGAGARRARSAVGAAGGIDPAAMATTAEAHRGRLAARRRQAVDHLGRPRRRVRRVGQDGSDGGRQGHQRLRRRRRHARADRRASTRTRWACAARRRCRWSSTTASCPRTRSSASSAAGCRSRWRRSTAGASASPRRRSASAAPRSTPRAPTSRSACSSAGRIADFQAIQFRLADVATELEAARLLDAARGVAQGARARRSRARPSMAKLYASEAAWRACDAAIQIHGGYGYTREFPVERYARDCRVTRIYEGTSEVQRIVIARSLLQDVKRRMSENKQRSGRSESWSPSRGSTATTAAPRWWRARCPTPATRWCTPGLHQTPEMIAAAAVQESVDAVGLSIMSGAHMTLFPAVIEALKTRGAGDVLDLRRRHHPRRGRGAAAARGACRRSSSRAPRRRRSSTGSRATSGRSTRAHESDRDGSAPWDRDDRARRRSPPRRTMRRWASACRICCTRTRPTCSAASPRPTAPPRARCWCA